MAHPHNEHRAHKVEQRRVGRMTAACRASGGRVHEDEPEDRKMVKRMVKKEALRADGGSVKARGDRPNRARGGKVGKKAGNTVNIVISPSANKPPMPPMAGLGAAGPMPPHPMPPPMPVAPPPMAGAPPLRPPPPALPAAVPGPSPMPPRSDGGRAYKRGGAVKRADGGASLKDMVVRGRVTDAEGKTLKQGDPDSPPVAARRGGYRTGGAVSAADIKGKTGIGDRTPIQHSGNKNDTQNIGRGPVITRKTGGPVMSENSKMGPNFHAGAGGGTERLEVAHNAQGYLNKNKAQAKAARHPGGTAT